MNAPATRPPRIALVTGTLAEPALRRVADQLARDGVCEPHVVVARIQVAALMTGDWLARHLRLPQGIDFDRVILTGHCRGDLGLLSQRLGVPVELGPADLNDLHAHLTGRHGPPEGYGGHSLEILAEINDAARMPLDRLIRLALALRRKGADLIDLGCDPQADREPWRGVAEAARELRGRGLRVSVDSFHPVEVELAVAAGAELVLSVNSTNVERAKDWGVEVVAIPDDPRELASLDRVAERLERDGVRFRLDPILEPLGLGFANSLVRYHDVRRRHPKAAMMMGVGNLSEMTQVDSAGVNALLVGICAELGIASVLTTQVINWARSSVGEIDVARRMMHHAASRGVPPKHLDDSLVMLRDPRLFPLDAGELSLLQARLTDANFRLFAEHPPDDAEGTQGGRLHVMNRDQHRVGDDPFPLFDQLGVVEPSHAFYLGYEMAKAVIALTLGKNYTQDQPLRFGMLTRPEPSHHENRRRRSTASTEAPPSPTAPPAGGPPGRDSSAAQPGADI